MATINFTVENHSIRADNQIELAQASNNYDTCKFEFDSSWSGFTLYAVMYQDAKNVFKKPLDSSNTCKIPADVLKKSGYLYIGARGEKADKTIATSVLFKIRVSNGAIDGNETGQEILNESQYEYLLGKINKLSEEVQKIEDEGITVDPNLSETSTNAIQNKAVAKAIVELKSDIINLNDYLGRDYSVINCNDFESTSETNWTLVNGIDSITVTHKNTFSTGIPTLNLDIPNGTYYISINYNSHSSCIGFYVDGSYSKLLTNGDTITITDGHSYQLRVSSTVAETITITDFRIYQKHTDGKIIQIENDITTITSSFEKATITIKGIDTEGSLLTKNGNINSTTLTDYHTKKYEVIGGQTYLISASTAYQNAYYAYFDEYMSMISVGTLSPSGGTVNSIIDEESVAPNNSKYVVVSWNTTKKESSVKIKSGYTVKSSLYGKKWVCIGDSLTDDTNSYSTKRYYDYVADVTGINPYVMGVSGSGYARKYDTNQAFYQRASSCPSDADVVTIFGSFNDTGTELSYGTVDDTEPTTIYGCINSTINALLEVNPLIIIGIVLPTPWKNTQPSDSGNANTYVSAIKKVCDIRSIPYLDLWKGSNLRPWDADFRTLAYSKDEDKGVHPNEVGHKIIAPKFKAFLESLVI